jgi:protein-arginine kinase activator protein McsA
MCGGELCDNCQDGYMDNISKSYTQRVQVYVCDNCGQLEAIGKEHKSDEYEKLLFHVKVKLLSMRKDKP